MLLGNQLIVAAYFAQQPGLELTITLIIIISYILVEKDGLNHKENVLW